MPKTAEPPSPFGIDFIDPLFAVALHLGFAHGILTKAWFRDWRWPQRGELFVALVFTLGFVTLVLSWLGYHESIRTKPLRGLGRFLLDIVIVLLYAVILVKCADFDAVLLCLVVIHGLFVLWDLFKIYEYPEAYRVGPWRQRYRRECITTGVFVLWAALWCVHWYTALGPPLILATAFCLTVGYRINKGVEIWRSIRAAMASVGQTIGNEMFRSRR